MLWEEVILMSNNYIPMHSLTNAYQAQNLLQQQRIYSKIVPTPKELTQGGCGYSLFVKQNVEQARTILQQAGISK